MAASMNNEDVLESMAARELHVKLIPGTEVMRDVEGIHFTHAAGGRGSVLIPHPSSDPRDPLNWSKPWKYSVVAVMLIYTFIIVESALSLGPINGVIAADLKLTGTQVGLLTGACVLALGYANMIIIPLSNIFGRRFAALLCSVLVIGSAAWEAVAGSYNSLLGARVLNGIATATSETVMVQVVADLFFVHERGAFMGIYFFAFFLGLFIGPVIAGNIAAVHGWRSFFWLCLDLGVFNLILVIFCFPETKFYRHGASAIDAELQSVPLPQDSAIPFNDKELHTRIEITTASPSASGQASPIAHVQGPSVLGRGRAPKSAWKLWQKPDPHWKTIILHDVFSPFRVFFFPIVFWTACNVAGPANLLLLWNLTESSVLGAPPYNMGAGALGNTNWAFVVGGVIGLLTAGPLSDYVAKVLTKRNNGVREAEMRLPALIPFFVTSVIGIVVGGLGYQNQWAWPIILVFGFGLTGLCVTSIPTIAVAYAVDCYKPISGEIMVVATVVKNTCGFAMSYWVSSLAASEGLITPVMVEFALVIGPLLCAVPLYFYGKKLRIMTKDSPMHKLEDHA